MIDLADRGEVLAVVAEGPRTDEHDSQGQVEEDGALHGEVEEVHDEERDALGCVVLARRGEPDSVVFAARDVRIVRNSDELEHLPRCVVAEEPDIFVGRREGVTAGDDGFRCHNLGHPAPMVEKLVRFMICCVVRGILVQREMLR